MDGHERGGEIPRKKHTPEQIITKLLQAVLSVSTGNTLVEAVRQIGITEQTFYGWRNKYGAVSIDQAKRLALLVNHHVNDRAAVYAR